MEGVILDNEILIAAVEQRPPLWMASHRQHKDKLVKAAMWREVATAVLPGVNIDEATELVQKRWKSLRDKFRRLLILSKKGNKSGAGLDDVEFATITWPYFHLLFFLKDTMETRATSGNYVSAARRQSAASLPSSLGAPLRPASQAQAASQPPRFDSPALSVSPSVQELLGDVTQFDDQCFDTVSEASVHSDDVSGPPVAYTDTQGATTLPEPAVAAVPQPAVADATSTPAQRKGRKRKNDEEVDSITKNVQDLCETLKKTEPRNEHEHFGLCLAKYMSKVPEERQLELKVKLMQLVMEYGA